MKINAALVTLSILIHPTAGIAQLGNDPALMRKHPPEMLEKRNRASAAIDRGRTLAAKGKLKEAIAEFRNGLRVEDELEKQYGGFTSVASYELAKAYAKLGQTALALEAYKSGTRWDPAAREIQTNGPPFILMTMDYAIALARAGKQEEAKAVYHSGLRRLNQVRTGLETMPLIVVFDADPSMVVWKYSETNLVAAATMAKAADMGSSGIAAAEEARALAPDWAVPLVFLALRSGSQQKELLESAFRIAQGEEVDWVASMAAARAIGSPADRQRLTTEAEKRHAEIGVDRRRGSSALQKARRELEHLHTKVASSLRKT